MVKEGLFHPHAAINVRIVATDAPFSCSIFINGNMVKREPPINMGIVEANAKPPSCLYGGLLQYRQHNYVTKN